MRWLSCWCGAGHLAVRCAAVLALEAQGCLHCEHALLGQGVMLTPTCAEITASHREAFGSRAGGVANRKSRLCCPIPGVPALAHSCCEVDCM